MVLAYKILNRLAEDFIEDLAARDSRIRRAYKLEALKRDKRGMSGKSFNPNDYYQGRDPLWNAEWYSIIHYNLQCYTVFFCFLLGALLTKISPKFEPKFEPKFDQNLTKI